MSGSDAPSPATADRQSAAEKLAEYEEVWELLAEKDVPFSEYAERALDVLEES